MKILKSLKSGLVLLIIAVLVVGVLMTEDETTFNTESDDYSENRANLYDMETSPDINTKKVKSSYLKRGAERKKDYLESFYHPKTIEEVSREREDYLSSNGSFEFLAKEPQTDNPIPWSSVGPMGVQLTIDPFHEFSGRIISFAMHGNNTNILYCGGASGGLWKSIDGGTSWFNLIDTLSCPSISSIAASQLSADNIVWFSTGSGFSGAGPQIARLYKSTNGGSSWVNVTAFPSGAAWISKIEVNVFNNNIVFIGSSSGLFRSTNGGSSFTQVVNAQVSDVITYTNLIAPDEVNVVAAVINSGTSSGIIRSTNGGANFSAITLPGFMAAQCGRITLARDAATSKTFALVGNSNGSFMGVWSATNKGANWTQRTFPTADMGGQQSYNQGIAVAPNGRVYVGYNARAVFTSTNDGMTWASGNSCHEDVQKIFVYNNSLVFHVSDGGIFKSINQGTDWITAGKLPLTQSYHLTADAIDPNQLWSGLQDNGLMTGFDSFFSWTMLSCCDGGDYVKQGAYQYFNLVGLSDNSANRYQRKLISAPISDPWEQFTAGIPSGQPWTAAGMNDLKSDGTSLYTSMGTFVYKTNGTALPWNQLGARPHPTNNIFIGRIFPGNTYTLAGFDIGTNPVVRRYNTSGGIWETPDLTGIPLSVRVTDFDYGSGAGRVLMSVSGTGAPRVFRSTNSGASWIDITGDLPPIVNVRCILANKTNDNVIYAGSDFGVFVTGNGGVNWYNFSEGMPSVCYVNDLEFAAGNNFIYAATYGRGIFRSSVLININIISTSATEYSLSQNYPNPFNPETKFEFSLRKQGFVKLTIYDAAGKEIEKVVNSNLRPGKYEAKWNATKYSTGVYFYSIEADGYSETKKMILIK